MGQKLRGFVGQSVSGVRKARLPAFGYFPPGTYSFVPTSSGPYRFAGWGHGGASSDSANNRGGGSGAFFDVVRNLTAGLAVTIVVPAAGGSSTATPSSTVVTLPNGEALTAGGGFPGAHASTPSIGGIASVLRPMPGDILLNGSSGGDAANGANGIGNNGGLGGLLSGSSGGGGGAPGNGPFKGGDGGPGNQNSTFTTAQTPGGGAGRALGTGSTTGYGGSGLVIIVQSRLRP